MKGFTSFVVKAYQAVKAAVQAYPGGATAVLTIVVALAARLGLHVTANELMVVISVAVAAFGTLVHTGAITKALSKSKEVK